MLLIISSFLRSIVALDHKQGCRATINTTQMIIASKKLESVGVCRLAPNQSESAKFPQRSQQIVTFSFHPRSSTMVKSVITSTEKTKLIPVGCDLFVALGTRKNRTWWCSSTMAVYTTGQSGRSFRAKSYLCGTIPDTHSLWGCLWHSVTREVEVRMFSEMLKISLFAPNFNFIITFNKLSHDKR